MSKDGDPPLLGRSWHASKCLILDFNLAHVYLTFMGEMRAVVKREYGRFQTCNVAFFFTPYSTYEIFVVC